MKLKVFRKSFKRLLHKVATCLYSYEIIFNERSWFSQRHRIFLYFFHTSFAFFNFHFSSFSHLTLSSLPSTIHLRTTSIQLTFRILHPFFMKKVLKRLFSIYFRYFKTEVILFVFNLYFFRDKVFSSKRI